jgi:prepilin-type N-terminal cleavage/methylation domain-containing protein
MRHGRGFTLVEVLLVVTISLIVAATALTLYARSHAQIGLREAAARLAADITLAQRDAAAHAEWRSVTFTDTLARYEVRGRSGTIVEPVSKRPFRVDLRALAPAVPIVLDTKGLPADSIAFGPTGEATAGGIVALEGSDTRFEVIVATGSGRITITETAAG